MQPATLSLTSRSRPAVRREDLDGSERWGTTPCNHSYHHVCLHEWMTHDSPLGVADEASDSVVLKQQKGCPECRSRLAATMSRMMR